MLIIAFTQREGRYCVPFVLVIMLGIDMMLGVIFIEIHTERDQTKYHIR